MTIKARTWATEEAVAVPLLIATSMTAAADTASTATSRLAIEQVATDKSEREREPEVGPVPTTAPEEDTQSNLSTGSSSGDSMARLVVEVKAGCYGATHNPPLSSSSRTLVSVHARTYCNSSTGSLYVSTGLERHRWYGWERIAHNANERYGTKTETQVKSLCKWGDIFTYRGDSYHRGTFGSKTYYGYSENEQRLLCGDIS